MPQSPRHKMRKQARRADGRIWIQSGALVSIRTYRRRYGVDQYTAYDDLRALGIPPTPGDASWAVRPDLVGRTSPAPLDRTSCEVAVIPHSRRPSHGVEKGGEKSPARRGA